MGEPDERKGVASVSIVPPEILRRKRKAIQRIIARHAYKIFERRGRIPGHQMEDWTQAESELLYPCSIDLVESAQAIILRVELPGTFTADQLRMSVETRQVTIEGQRAISVICGHVGKTHTTHTETRIQRIFRVYDLPTDVYASSATATLLGSIVEIRLPKIFIDIGHATSASPVALL